MSRIDIHEMAGGLFLILTGIGFAGHAVANYSIGSITRMGPGMVPTALGALLMVFGLILVAAARTEEPRPVAIRITIPAIILLSVLVFGLLVAPFGLFPAIAGCVLVATLAEGVFRPRFSLTLAAVLCVLAWLVFIVALQLSVPLVSWPF